MYQCVYFFISITPSIFSLYLPVCFFFFFLYVPVYLFFFSLSTSLSIFPSLSTRLSIFSSLSTSLSFFPLIIYASVYFFPLYLPVSSFSLYLPVSLSFYQSILLQILTIYPFIYLQLAYLLSLSTCLSTCPYLVLYLFIYLSLCLSTSSLLIYSSLFLPVYLPPACSSALLYLSIYIYSIFTCLSVPEHVYLSHIFPNNNSNPWYNRLTLTSKSLFNSQLWNYKGGNYFSLTMLTIFFSFFQTLYYCNFVVIIYLFFPSYDLTYMNLYFTEGRMKNACQFFFFFINHNFQVSKLLYNFNDRNLSFFFLVVLYISTSTPRSVWKIYGDNLPHFITPEWQIWCWWNRQISLSFSLFFSCCSSLSLSLFLSACLFVSISPYIPLYIYYLFKLRSYING